MLFLQVPQSISPRIAKVKFGVQGTHSSLQTLGSERRQQALSHGPAVLCTALPDSPAAKGPPCAPAVPVTSQPSSAPQASQPGSCPGSRALGFRAPGSQLSSQQDSLTDIIYDLTKIQGRGGIFRLIWQVRQQGSPLVSLEPQLDLGASGRLAWASPVSGALSHDLGMQSCSSHICHPVAKETLACSFYLG